MPVVLPMQLGTMLATFQILNLELTRRLQIDILSVFLWVIVNYIPLDMSFLVQGAHILSMSIRIRFSVVTLEY